MYTKVLRYLDLKNVINCLQRYKVQLGLILREFRLEVNRDYILQIKVKMCFFHGEKFRNNTVKISVRNKHTN